MKPRIQVWRMEILTMRSNRDKHSQKKKTIEGITCREI